MPRLLLNNLLVLNIYTEALLPGIETGWAWLPRVRPSPLVGGHDGFKQEAEGIRHLPHAKRSDYADAIIHTALLS